MMPRLGSCDFVPIDHPTEPPLKKGPFGFVLGLQFSVV